MNCKLQEFQMICKFSFTILEFVLQLRHASLNMLLPFAPLVKHVASFCTSLFLLHALASQPYGP